MNLPDHTQESTLKRTRDRNHEPWHETDDPDRFARGAAWRIGLWIVVAVVFFGLLGGGIYAVKVGLSGVKGAGDATRITNDGRNRVNSQEWFHAQFAQIKTADKNLDEAATNLARATEKDRDFFQTNYTGLKNRCVEMVNNYNAEAQKVSRGKWIDPALPHQIDDSDPTTDCKETAK